MKLIIAGSRTFIRLDSLTISGLLSQLLPNWQNSVDTIISGGATGVDNAGENFAKAIGLPILQYLPNWEQFGHAAGPIRNREMAMEGDALLLIWDGSSKGSKNMKAEMEKLSKPVYEVILK